MGDVLGEANSLQNLANVKKMQADYAQAEKLYLRAVAYHRKIRNRFGEANCLRSMGDLNRMQAHLAKADQLYRQALGIYHEIGHRLGEANTLQSLGDTRLCRTSMLRLKNCFCRH